MNFPSYCYICKYCNRAFREGSHLLSHKQEHHQEELLKEKKLRKSTSIQITEKGQDDSPSAELPQEDVQTIGPLVVVNTREKEDLPPVLYREDSYADNECSFSSASTIVSSDSSSRGNSLCEESITGSAEQPAIVDEILNIQPSQLIQTRSITSLIEGAPASESVLTPSLTITPVIKPGVSGSVGPRKKFTCIHCFKKFATKWNCKVHMATHTGKMPLKCQFCAQIFYKLVEKVAHELTHRETMKQAKSMNPRVEVTKLNVNDLPKLNLNDPPKPKETEIPKLKGSEEADVPTLKITDSSETIPHAVKPDDPKPVISIVSKLEAAKPSTELIPVVVQTLEKKIQKAIVKPITDWPGITKSKKRRKARFSSLSFKCKQCCRSYSSKSALGLHMKRTHYLSQPSLECSYCSKIFFTSQERVDHEKSHANHTCPYCNLRLANSKNLMGHMKSVHPLTAKKSNGNISASCSTLLEDSQPEQHISYLKEGAKDQMLSCENELEFRCDSEMENKNEKRKEIPRGFQCYFCNKVFRLKLTLKVHERIHTGIRPYKCSDCPLAFTQSHVLTEHFRTHTGEKPFSCVFCARKFSHKSSYNVHLKAHQRNGHAKVSKFDAEKSKNRIKGAGRKVPIKTLELAEGITQTLSSGLLVYICDLCKLTFDYRVDANKHSKIHT